MSRYSNESTGFAKSQALDAGLREYMLRVYNYMATALAITGIAATLTMSFDPIARLMFNFNEYGNVMGTTMIGMIIMIAPIGIAFYFFAGATRMDVQKAQTLLWIYSILTGMSLSSLGFIYTGTSIARTFFITASVFGAMSIYGYSTKRDLTSFGSFMVMGMFGLLIVSVVNMFLNSSAIFFVTSILGVFIFMGIIAWNTQKMKATYFAVGGGEMGQRMAVVSAFSAYLDFINLFLYMLRFFGTRRD
jgi:FtsH-binding integral membrane protein